MTPEGTPVSPTPEDLFSKVSEDLMLALNGLGKASSNLATAEVGTDQEEQSLLREHDNARRSVGEAFDTVKRILPERIQLWRTKLQIPFDNMRANKLIEIDPNVSQISLFPNEDDSQKQINVFKKSFRLRINGEEVYAGTPVVGRKMELVAQLGKVLDDQLDLADKVIKAPLKVFFQQNSIGRKLRRDSRALDGDSTWIIKELLIA